MQYEITDRRPKTKRGSALIFTVTISVLLALIAVLFILRSSVDSAGTLSISDDQEISYAVDTILTQLGRELVLDTPGVAGQEYQDYPWDNGATDPQDTQWKRDDRWLAGLEPNKVGADYYWGHVSDLYGDRGAAKTNYAVRCAVIIDGSPAADGDPADADGDGVADSLWVKAMADPGPDGRYSGTDAVPLRTSKGKQIYLALRVVDLGGMLNINTGYKFSVSAGDGSSLHQVNLLALAARPLEPYSSADDDAICKARVSTGQPADYQNNIRDYEEEVARRLDDPNLAAPRPNKWQPFDIGDELELRYRYVLNQEDVDTRSEVLPGWDLRSSGNLRTPVRDTAGLKKWFRNAASCDPSELDDPNYAYRHLATTYNCDRLIDPNGDSMININNINTVSDVDRLFRRLLYVLNTNRPTPVDPNVIAQLAVNIKDYRDGDEEVTAFRPNTADPNGLLYNQTFYGHSRPFMWISELAYRQTTDPPALGGAVHKAYAVELYVRDLFLFLGASNSNYQLVVTNAGVPTAYAIDVAHWGDKQFFTFLNNSDAGVNTLMPSDGNSIEQPTLIFDADSVIELQRKAMDGTWVRVDRVDSSLVGNWIPAVDTDANGVSVMRDLSEGHCIRRLWSAVATPPTLGKANGYTRPGPPLIQYDTADANFPTIGDLGKVLKMATKDVLPAHREDDVLFNWMDPNPVWRNVSSYLTAMPRPWPALEGDKVYGRVNINTAPAFVIAQLPWMQYPYDVNANSAAKFDRARAVVTTRDQIHGFKTVADVLDVHRMRELGSDGQPLPGPPGSPDLSSDDVPDDFEERDVLFSRISNLATVRSDVFCAYIMVRLGETGPQKRFIAILDRSDVKSPSDKVRIRALHPVADSR